MYIPRPAKLLFQYDDGWNRFIDKKHVDEWQLLSVEKMLVCSTCAIGVLRYCCSSPECTHSRFFCQTCKSKACSPCGLKGTEQWIAQQRHVLPDCEWQHRRQILSQEKMIRRFVSHIPARHLKMFRYYGFLANRK